MTSGGERVEPFLNHVAGALHRAMRMCDDFCIPVGEPTATAVLAALAARHSDVPVRLVFFGPSENHAPRKLARHLGLGLLERVVSPDEFDATAADAALLLGQPAPQSQAAQAALYGAVREARLYTQRLVVSHGSDFLSQGATDPAATRAGLAKLEGRFADLSRLRIRAPFLDPRLLGMRAPDGAAVLVNAAKALGVE